MVDQNLICADCGSPFAFSIAEQAFYAERAFRQPVRCAQCRARHRAERNADVIASYESAAHRQSWTETFATYGGHVVSAARTAGRGRSAGSPSKEVFPATCAACGRDTQVPFQPRSGRPVFCRECFNQRRGH